MDIKQYTEKVKNYKLRVASRYKSISIEVLREELPHQDEYLVSTKYDGHFYCLVKEGEKVVFLNPSGKTVEDHPVLEKAKETLKSLKQAIIPGELYLSGDEKTRSFNVTKGLTEKDDNIMFAAFDILEIDDEWCTKTNFEIFDQLKTIFPGTGHIHYAETHIVEKKNEIAKLFTEKVEINENEGIVVKSIDNVAYKVKPKYTLDAVIVGFAEGDGDRAGLLRDFLLAFMKKDGSYQIFAHMSHGFNDETRKSLLDEYRPKVVDSDFIEVARNRVGFQMVKPEIVVEFTCLDVISEDSSGAISKMNLIYNPKSGYAANGSQTSVSVTIPVFHRFRTDKEVNKHDVRFAQVEDLVSLEETNSDVQEELNKSLIIDRRVFSKISKDNTMVRKFVVIQTNKGKSKNYADYVFHYTDYSPGRAEPLKRDVRVSNSKGQIFEIFNEQIEKNIKKGWAELE